MSGAFCERRKAARTVSLSIEEGQMVWFASQVRYIASGYVAVTSVDRLWAVLDNGFRANRYTGVCDGHGLPSPGCIYRTLEDYDRETMLYNSWASLRKEIAAMEVLPEGVSRRKLLMVRRLLQIGE